MKRKKTHIKTASFAVMIGAWVFLAFSCSGLTGSSDTVSSNIVWGEHIEGVRIGDDSTTVIQKLGPPSSKQMGDFAGWIFEYKKTPYNSITILISNSTLHSGVYSIIVSQPYQGATKKGVRLGMTRE